MKARFSTRPMAIEIDLNSAAVIVVDMQNAFASRGGVFDRAGIDISQASRTASLIGRILDAARKTGIQIVYLQMGFRDDLSDAGGPDSPNWHKEIALRLLRESPEYQGKILTRGSRDFAIIDELKPQPGDVTVVKSRYSGFVRTELHAILCAKQIHHLFFTGIATNVCVESTIRDAFFLEYWPILITDSTTQAGPDYLHQATVYNVENHFGWTLSSEEFLRALKEQAPLGSKTPGSGDL
jgi:ureidoacrylate peracid hydrolase